MRKFIEELVEKVLEHTASRLKIENDSLKSEIYGAREQLLKTTQELQDATRELAILKSRIALGIDEVVEGVTGGVGAPGGHPHSVFGAPNPPAFSQAIMRKWMDQAITPSEMVKSIETMERLGMLPKGDTVKINHPLKITGRDK